MSRKSDDLNKRVLNCIYFSKVSSELTREIVRMVLISGLLPSGADTVINFRWGFFHFYLVASPQDAQRIVFSFKNRQRRCIKWSDENAWQKVRIAS